jgi:hypothetical protein
MIHRSGNPFMREVKTERFSILLEQITHINSIGDREHISRLLHIQGEHGAPGAIRIGGDAWLALSPRSHL